MATSLLHELKTTQTITTIYSHENTFINNELRFNCYGLMDYLIDLSHKDAFKDLVDLMEILHQKGVKRSFDKGKPSPENFFHIFKNLFYGSLISRFWQGIKDISCIIPGDILVYLEPGYVGDESSERQNYRTHIVLVSRVIALTADGLQLSVIDSAHEFHNEVDDTRHRLGIRNGLGEACLFIKDSGIRIENEQDMTLYHLSWEINFANPLEKFLFSGRLLPPLL